MYREPSYRGARVTRGDEFETITSQAYRAASDAKQERIMRNLKRDWQRHPELRAQYGGSFERYMRSMKNVTFA